MKGHETRGANLFQSILVFSAISVAMTMVNESAFKICRKKEALILAQNSLTFVFVLLFQGWSVRPQKSLIMAWSPCALAFCISSYSASQAMRLTSLQTLYLFQSASGLLTSAVEYSLMRTLWRCDLVFAGLLVTSGSFLCSWSDCKFDWPGCGWCILHVFSWSIYSLLVKTRSELSQISANEMSFWNNMTFYPVLIVGMFSTGPSVIFNDKSLYHAFFVQETSVVLWTSCLLAFAASISTYNLQSAMSSTAFVTLNNINKIPPAAIVMVLKRLNLHKNILFGCVLCIFGSYLLLLSRRYLASVHSIRLKSKLIILVVFLASQSSIIMWSWDAGTSKRARSRSAPLPLNNLTLHRSHGDNYIRARRGAAIRYNRGLCTSLGDRFSVYLTVAAMAESINATCYVYWCENNPTSLYFYRWSEVARFTTLPSSLVMLSEAEFEIATRGIDDISFENTSLPAMYGFDGVYTLADKTMALPARLNANVSHERFEAAYRTVSAQWQVHVNFGEIYPGFVAFYFRDPEDNDGAGGQRYTTGFEMDCNARFNRSSGESSFCTREALELFSTAGVPIVLVADDLTEQKRILADFGHILTVPYSGNKTKEEIEMRNLGLMMNSIAIIQHAPSGWSALSGVASMARKIPLLSTWQLATDYLDIFSSVGGRPSDMVRCGTSGGGDVIASFVSQVQRLHEESRSKRPPSQNLIGVNLAIKAAGLKNPRGTVLRYNRRMCNGLGDRITVHLALAAMLEAVNATCFVYWCEDNDYSVQYYQKWSEVSKHTILPSRLIVLSASEFPVWTSGVEDIVFENTTLPAMHAFDGVYSLADKTMILPDSLGAKVDHEAYVAAYRRAAAEWNILYDLSGYPPHYVVFHLREGDKLHGHDKSGYIPQYEIDCAKQQEGSTWITTHQITKAKRQYCTHEALHWLEASGIPVVLLTEDKRAKRRLLADFGHMLLVPNSQGEGKTALEMRDLALMMNAAGILQHAATGWSSYSSMAAMARRVPLLNTWRGSFNLLKVFDSYGGRPGELASCDDGPKMEAIEAFGAAVQGRIARASGPRTYPDE